MMLESAGMTQKQERWKYQVEDAVRTLKEAEKIRRNPKLLKAARAAMSDEIRDLEAAGAKAGHDKVGSALMNM